MTRDTDSDRSPITRRRFVAGTLVTGAAAAVPGVAEAEAEHKHKHKPAKPKSTMHTADVAIVGAGLSGLTAARQIRAAGKSVIVLEARDRVGGRCFSRSIGAGASDVANMGATFVGPTQTQILGLMGELGISKFPVYSTGNLLWYESGKLTPYTGTIPPANDPASAIELGAVVLPEIDQMAQTVPLDAPWTAPNAEAWDSMTADTWAQENIKTSDGQKLYSLAVDAVFSVLPRDVSFLYFLFYVHAAGSINDLVANAGQGGAQDFRVTGGTQGVAIKMASQLGHKRVLLSQPVRRISQGPKSVFVYADKATVKAKQVIVAIPPHLAGRIAYEPGLPAARDQLTQRMPIGSLIKTIAVYDTPFWRAQGLNGQVTSDTGPVTVMFDASPASGTPGVLLGFIDGDDARTLHDSPAATRQAAALKSYTTYFGQQAGSPRLYIDQVWDKEIYTGGCPVGLMPPGVMTEYGGALRAPAGRIHWAGTETATVWTGYMDGAVQSGKRAASEALAAL
ncbi:MAG TPA: flavin monoamine oxidase family protein [Solirubrobacteraceae bacterium]|nr:flavin monoamine oxidase family protein [Solirubrobacteraceae bacterium]